MWHQNDPLKKRLSMHLGEGWCFFGIGDNIDCKEKTVHLVRFQTPTEAELRSHCFSAISTVTFSVNASQDLFSNEEILFTIGFLVEPLEVGNQTFVSEWKEQCVRSCFSKLGEYLKDFSERHDSYSEQGEHPFKVEVNVKEELQEQSASVELPFNDSISTNELSEPKDICSRLKDQTASVEGRITDINSTRSSSNEIDQNISVDAEKVPIDDFINKGSSKVRKRRLPDPKLAVVTENNLHPIHKHDTSKGGLKTSDKDASSKKNSVGKSELESTENFKCPHCPDSFPNKKLLKSHIRSKHWAPAPRRLTSSKSKLYVKTYTRCYKETSSGFECAECSEVLPTLNKLNAHRKTSHIPVEAKCEQCGKAFSEKKLLARHLEISHPIEPIAKHLVCDQCPQTFQTSKAFSMHKYSHHFKGASLIERRRKFPSYDSSIPESKRTCKLCGKVLLHLASLKRHLSYGKYFQFWFRPQFIRLNRILKSFMGRFAYCYIAAIT